MNRGTYCLILRLDQRRRLAIGRRPQQDFPAGFYGYVGSALNNLDKRLARHRSTDKRLHWHIDYFLKAAKVVGAQTIISGQRLECALSRQLAQVGEVIPGFGSSDCRCQGHLFHFRSNPAQRIRRICQGLGAAAAAPGGGEVGT
jgi:Uri superfamily endonuclease